MLIGRFYLKKDYLLLGCMICTLVSCYQLAIKKTVVVWQMNHQFKSQLSKATLAEQPAYLARQDQALKSILKNYQADSVNYRSNLVTAISQIGDQEHVRISEVPTQVNLVNPPYQVQKLTLKGDFFSLLKTMKRLQQLENVGYMRSAVFKNELFPEHASPSNELRLDLYMEIIKK